MQVRMKVSLPKINMERLTRDVKEMILEANQAAAKAFVRTASKLPYVSGQLRGSFAPLAEAVGTSLGHTIPPSSRSFPAHKDQSFGRGRSMQSHTVSDKTFRYVNEVPYLFNQGPEPEQIFWNDAWRQAGLKAVDAFYDSINNSDLPSKIFDRIEVI